MTRLVLVLHSHLPWVLHHGRWPHGSDWLTEAAVDTYLPLLETLLALADEQVAAPISLGITPVLANQLAHPDFRTELQQFFAQRLAACAAAPASLARTDESDLLPVVRYWQARYARLQARFESLDGDLLGAFRALEAAGRLELFSSAATHGFLPLLGRDESIRLQLLHGAHEHRRLFGRSAAGCWLPECAYRPSGAWAPLADAPGAGQLRRGLEGFVAEAGFRYTVMDAHLVAGGVALGSSGGMADVDTAPHSAIRSPYLLHRLHDDRTARELLVFARDPHLSSQVWSRHEGYPGDGRYLEFHKMRWPGGLKLWRVTGAGVDLGAKAAYAQDAAGQIAREHAGHFAALAALIGEGQTHADAVLCAPFDTELFGHWWFEGPDFLGHAFRALARQSTVRPSLAGAAAAGSLHAASVVLPSGTWGANGDSSMWLSDQTAWTWRRLWPLEQRFWEIAPVYLSHELAHPALAQAARALLLAQSSDWQFIISTGAAADYAERRFAEHCVDLERLLHALEHHHDHGAALAAELHRVDDLFPDVLATVAAIIRGTA